MRRLWLDTSGTATTNLLSFAPTWFFTFSVFLMNVQLGRHYVQRDVVDHAAALAADTTSKTYCENSGGSTASVNTSIQTLMQMVSSSNPCQVTQKESGSGGESGGREIDVTVTCRFPCTIPLASQVMCNGGYVTFTASQKTTSMGCDGS
jgi:hypothetical protein